MSQEWSLCIKSLNYKKALTSIVSGVLPRQVSTRHDSGTVFTRESFGVETIGGRGRIDTHRPTDKTSVPLSGVFSLITCPHVKSRRYNTLINIDIFVNQMYYLISE